VRCVAALVLLIIFQVKQSLNHIIEYCLRRTVSRRAGARILTG
jgi:hypothetical protein